MEHSLKAALRLTAPSVRWPSLNFVCAAAALVYATLVVVSATRTAHTGFNIVFGGPILLVESGSAAAAAGLRRGDVIVAVDGRETRTQKSREEALNAIAPGAVMELAVERAGERLSVSIPTRRGLPMGAVAGILAAFGLLLVSFVAHHDTFQRISTIYVVFMAGSLAMHSAMWNPILAVPLLFAMALAAPATCHQMILFPVGQPLGRRVLLLVYGVPLLLAAVMVANSVGYWLGWSAQGAYTMGRRCLELNAILAAIYLTVGAILRRRRMRARHAEIDPIARRWIDLGGVAVVVPLLALVAWQTVSPDSCLGGGFQHLIAAAMAGGSLCMFVALSRERFGDLDRLLRRGAGHLLAGGVAAAALLGMLALLGSRVSGGGLLVGGTFLAGMAFAPLGARLQRSIDDRFSAEHARARRILGQVVEHAAATLDLAEIAEEVTRRVRDALGADGCALEIADAEEGFQRAAQAGVFDPAREASWFAVPIPGERPARLLVAPAESRPVEDGERELLATTAAGLSVAFANARAHGSLRAMSERLRAEVEQSERRRREIARLKERIEEEKVAVEAELARVGGVAPVIGEGLRPTFDLVHRVARSEANVLVTGETGVGKELVARAIHAGSARREGPFVVVDCGAVAAGVFESSLFGHERGAFTGAVRAAQGCFRAAQGGTLFLDEIGELPLELQPKLLRVLQEREVIPVGADHPVPVDVRVVAGTNRDLDVEVRAGRFREDLLYRLRVVDVVVPPLRARKADIPDLAAGFLRVIAEQRDQRPRTLSPEALEVLLSHDWPGNVRELQHVIEAAAFTCPSDVIGPGDLGIAEEVFRRRAEDAVARAGDTGPGLRETLSGLERDRLIEVLREHGGNRTSAAKALGLSRTSLRRRLARYGIG